MNCVGATGFEPATTWSQTRSATGLRYTPFPLAFLACNRQRLWICGAKVVLFGDVAKFFAYYFLEGARLSAHGIFVERPPDCAFSCEEFLHHAFYAAAERRVIEVQPEDILAAIEFL